MLRSQRGWLITLLQLLNGIASAVLSQSPPDAALPQHLISIRSGRISAACDYSPAVALPCVGPGNWRLMARPYFNHPRWDLHFDAAKYQVWRWLLVQEKRFTGRWKQCQFALRWESKKLARYVWLDCNDFIVGPCYLLHGGLVFVGKMSAAKFVLMLCSNSNSGCLFIYWRSRKWLARRMCEKWSSEISQVIWWYSEFKCDIPPDSFFLLHVRTSFS